MTRTIDLFIIAVQIFAQHLSGEFGFIPIDDDSLEVCGVHPDHLAGHEKDRLRELGFVVDTSDGYARFVTSLYRGCHSA